MPGEYFFAIVLSSKIILMNLILVKYYFLFFLFCGQTRRSAPTFMVVLRASWVICPCVFRGFAGKLGDLPLRFNVISTAGSRLNDLVFSKNISRLPMSAAEISFLTIMKNQKPATPNKKYFLPGRFANHPYGNFTLHSLATSGYFLQNVYEIFSRNGHWQRSAVTTIEFECVFNNFT
jgi:hypothetical protein